MIVSISGKSREDPVYPVRGLVLDRRIGHGDDDDDVPESLDLRQRVEALGKRAVFVDGRGVVVHAEEAVVLATAAAGPERRE